MTDATRVAKLFEELKIHTRKIQSELEAIQIRSFDHFITVEGEPDAYEAMRILLRRSASFRFEPLPDYLFRFEVKEESLQAIGHLEVKA